LARESPPFDGELVRLDVVCAPARGAKPWDYWTTARETCGGEGLDRLALQFHTKSTPDAVASAYLRWMRADGLNARTSDETELRAVYAGCLHGFRNE